MIEFRTQVRNEPCTCRVLFYAPGTDYIITGTGYGDAISGDDPSFEFTLLDDKDNPLNHLMKAMTMHDTYLLMEEAHVMSQEHYYQPY